MEPRLVTKPAGAIPGGLFGQIVVALTTLMIAAFIIAYAIQGGDTGEEAETTSSEPVLSGEGMQRRVEHTIEEQRNASNSSAERPQPATAYGHRCSSPPPAGLPCAPPA